LLSLGLNLCCRSTRGDPTAHELDAIAAHPLLADDDIMPTESRESRTAGVRINATALLKCGLVQALGVGCKYLQQDMLPRRVFPCLCPDTPEIGITLLIKLRVGTTASTSAIISVPRSAPQVTPALSGG
jgi:hypothetical protein